MLQEWFQLSKWMGRGRDLRINKPGEDARPYTGSHPSAAPLPTFLHDSLTLSAQNLWPPFNFLNDPSYLRAFAQTVPSVGMPFPHFWSTDFSHQSDLRAL